MEGEAPTPHPYGALFYSALVWGLHRPLGELETCSQQLGGPGDNLSLTWT